MSSAIAWFLICICFSLGISLQAAPLGTGLAQMIDNAFQSGSYSCSEETINDIRDFVYSDSDLANFTVYQSDLENVPNVSNQVIQESIGIDGWKNFLNQHQGNVVTNTNFPSFSCGNYSFQYGVDYRQLDNGYEVVPFVDVFLDGEKLLPDYTSKLYSHTIPSNIRFSSYEEDSLKYYNALNGSLFYDSSLMAVRYLGSADYSAFLIDLSSYITDDVVEDPAPSDIGKAGDYPISADGTITLPDGTVITPNADGTYTINGNVYSPTYNIGAYDDTALLDLLNQILQRISDLENSLTFEEELETEDELDETQEEALENVQAYDGTMSEFLFSSPKWTTVFPFCIPWDFVRGVKLLSAAPVAPRFEIPFEIPSFGQFPGYNTVITLDLSEYDEYFVPVRWFSTMFFLIGLGFITFKIVKGAT